MNYYPHHIGDYHLATAHLSEREDLAYRRMLDCYYRDEKPFPDDAERIARLIRMPDATDIVTALLAEFFWHSEHGWRQKRADTEIRDFRKKAENARRNGKKGGRPPGRKASNGAGENQGGSFSLSEKNPGRTGSKANQNQNQNQNQGVPSSNELGAGAQSPPSATPPPDPVKALFDTGVAVLVGGGVPERNARAVIGKLRQQVGDDEAFRIIALARDKSNPTAYVMKAMAPKPKLVSL